jgi:predicted ATPase/class 3 adenylate cyclase
MIRNFSQDDLVYKGGGSMILHGNKGNFNETVCIKVLNDEFPNSDQSWYFENEYEFSLNTKCSSLRKATGQTKIENHKAIIFEYIVGSDLNKYLLAKQRSFDELMSVAVELAFALSELHKENIIHNNINPGNILIQNSSSKIFLIDLQIASRNSLKVDDTNNHIIHEADLSCIAPEQTGRINRIIDYRTDLYSLGAVLYKIFTGKFPFDHTDPIEQIYAHLAKTPIPPDQAINDFSPAVSAIIMKLLSKNAEDRYQSAIGVYYDLKYCLSHKFREEEIFFPGTNDFSGKLFLHPKLYGKEKERKNIFGLFENCARGSRELLLVDGYSGAGKTSLITELQKPVSDRQGFFVSGKFEQFQQDTPYSAFVLAFGELINYLLTKDDIILAQWRNNIIESIGQQGRVLTELIPEIEALIGIQPDIPYLKGPELQNRFNYVLGNFIKAIACEEHPLVIFIDNLQWADVSSLNLFDLILADKTAKYIMLIGAYRGNEVTEDHPLADMLNKLRKDHVLFSEIEVVNLRENDVKTFVDELLRTDQDNSSELSQLIFAKTKGNPFYIHHFLQSIYDGANLYFDFSKKEWCWNKQEIAELNVSGNVAELMKWSILKLPDEAINVLKVAACLGNRFNLNKLSISMNEKESQLQSILQPALAEGLIISAASHYKFAHDRIQQTIYSLISEEEKKQYHLNIGKSISANTDDNNIGDAIFDLVNHWNIGSDILTDQHTKDYVAKLNLLAGRKARTSAAFEQALLYFEKGLLLLANDSWRENYDFTIQLFDETSEIAFLCGEMARAEDLVTAILNNTSELRSAIKAYEVRIQILIAENKQNEAIALGLDILRKLGHRFPNKPGKVSTITGLININMLLGNKPSSFFEQLPLVTDAEKLAAYRILSELLSASYFAAPDLVPLLIFKMVHLSVKEGLSPKSPFAFAALGYILSAYIGQVDKGIHYGDIAINLSNRLKTEEQVPRLLMTYNVFLVHWKKKLSDLNDELDKAFKIGLETGDNEYTSYLSQNITYNSLYSGIHLHKLADKSEVLDRQVQKFRQDLTIIRLRILRQGIDNFINATEDPDVLCGAIFDEKQITIEQTPQNYSYFQNLNLQKLLLALIFNRNGAGYTYAMTCEKYQESIRGSALYLVFYFYQSLAMTSVFPEADDKKKKYILKKLRSNIKQLKKYESFCKDNYKHKRLLVEAEYNYISGNKAKARSLYDYAIKIAVESHMIQDEAICWERTAAFYKNEKNDQVALFYLNNALSAYQRWGADAKVKQMRVIYDDLRNASAQTNKDIFLNDLSDVRNVNIDMATIVKASTALSGEIVLENLLKKLMQILIENAGAQKGFLILEKNFERVIEAEIIADTGEVITLQSLPVNVCETIAKSVVNYVSFKRETVLLDNAANSQLFGDDVYIKKQQSKSILCIPLINQGKLQAIIYLANDITVGAFTEKRLDFIRLISGQMAISIENALFYNELETRVEERTNELQIEKKKTDDLLLNILPKEVADELKNTGRSKARRYDQVTVMFTDFKNFTQHSEEMDPEELVGEVDFCFRKFDQIVTKYKLEKIKTIGDAYLCVGGFSEDPGSAVRLLKAAIEMRDFITHMHEDRQSRDGVAFQMRIGITTGPVVAGIVGEKKFAYDIWGDTVNTAARMEQSGHEGKINISGITYELIKDEFECTHRGKISAKNKGEMDMYFVEREKVPSENCEILI